MKVEDITKAVINISGGDFDSFQEETKVQAIAEVQFAIDNPETTPGEWHNKVYPDKPYKTVKAKDKAMYKTILATIKALKGITAGSDEKGDFVECDTVEAVKEAPKVHKGNNWGSKGLNLHTKSTTKLKPEGF